MTKWDTIAVVGVGLIGGSIGLAVRERGLARRVIGIGRRASRLQLARRCGAVTSTTTRLAAGVSAAELVVVCTPVGRIVADVVDVAAHCRPDTLITDVGSTKSEIVQALEGNSAVAGRFVGSHPLAGSDRSGVRHASADLFVGRVTVLTETVGTARDRVARLRQFWRSLGATVITMSPAAHDQSLAMTSHAAHVVASALALATDARDLPLAASGWGDTTRIAAADPELWCQILLSNRAAVLTALDKLGAALADLRSALDRSDATRLTQLLEAGKQTRDSMGS